MQNYDHSKIEQEWQERWYSNNIYEAIDFSEKPKKYILAEFPYPSGKSLHAGHMMRFTVPDIYSRYLRMKGYNVLFPFGWDAFGLPAENYAVKTGVHPAIITQETIDHYRRSFKKMGYGIDWNREINTTDPLYYKWTQWIFLKFYKAGLAKFEEKPIWWCEQLKTVLSDEEVLTDKTGNKISERGEFPVVKKKFKQWVLEITKYADKLIQGLDEVDFPESIKAAQTNWIGKSEGAQVQFKINDEIVEVFTTRPDTLYGVTFLVLSPEHALIKKLLPSLTNLAEVKAYIENAGKMSDLERLALKEKTGVELKGISAIHPFADITRTIPVFIADYVLADYGTGAIMAVPAHDDRDFEFAQKYQLPMIQVIKPDPSKPQDFNDTEKKAFVTEGIMINCGNYDGKTSSQFFTIACDRLEKEKTGKRATSYKIRDWIFSRQRYWGEPIPMVHKQNGDIYPLCDPDNVADVEKTLPLKLPEVPDFNPTADGASPLEKNKDWVKITEADGTISQRETNTMPNWAGSCWYYIRYLDAHNNNEFANKEKLKYWLPVDRYFGGAEHTTLHLLYSRFWHKFLYDKGLVPTKEPYAWRLNGGILLGPDGKKMSKSRGNVIEPSTYIEKYGADALRLFICFLGPYEETYPWNDNGIKATQRLVKNIWELSEKVKDMTETPLKINKAYHKMVKNVTTMSEELKMNTCVSEFMIFVNTIKDEPEIPTLVWKGFLQVLAPFAPFISEELWARLNKFDAFEKSQSIHLSSWPTFDPELAAVEVEEIPVQINGKLRGLIATDSSDTQETVTAKVIADSKLAQYLQGKTPSKVVFVPKKIVNIVL